MGSMVQLMSRRPYWIKLFVAVAIVSPTASTVLLHMPYIGTTIMDISQATQKKPFQ